MRITVAESTDLFTGSQSSPLQIVRVWVETNSPATLRIEGAAVSTPAPVPAPASGSYEIPVRTAGHLTPGTSVPITVLATSDHERAQSPATLTVAEPGWTMWMVSHFHYDPVWWSTQGQFTEARLVLPDEDGKLPDQRTAFELVRLHMEKARRDPDYKFVLAEVDYLKPYFDVYPGERSDLGRLLADGRMEIVGGNYNEPNTNLTSAETTIRNAVYGIGFQRDILGGDPQSAWQLDVFGHDPGYPGLMAQAGLTSSSWARGPFHQWGPDDNTRMQFPAEFEWVSPDGTGLLTSYMANHYGAGWVLNQPETLQDALAAAYKQFRELAPVAATRNVMLPVGADHVIPARWVTDVHREWNARYVWPRFVTAIPRDFFAAVRREARERGIWITPQTRDMNPVYTGKDVSYIDTKQAHRAAEVAVCEGERLATLAALRGAGYPGASLDRAWRLLVYGAHHDAITGTESDQVYLDLLAGWREAWQRGDQIRREAARFLSAGSGSAPDDRRAREPSPGSVMVANGLGRERSGTVRVAVTLPEGSAARGVRVRDGGAAVPTVAEGVTRHGDGSLAAATLTFRAESVPGLGVRAYDLEPCDELAGWEDVPGTRIENDAFTVRADPERGGTVRVFDKRAGRELLRGPGNELTLQDEYDKHPKWGEGPWHLSPRGPGIGSAAAPAQVRAQRGGIGSRLVATFALGDLSVVSETLLLDGTDRVEFRTHVDGSIGKDRLLRVRFPADVPGGLPVYQTATAVIGRPFGDPEADAADRWFSLDNPAWQWFGVGAAATVQVNGQARAIGVAEVVTGAAPGGDQVRDLVVALGRSGVTATVSRDSGQRCGDAAVDSNLPDVRICVGGPDVNEFAARVLESAEPQAKLLDSLVTEHGAGRVWVPSELSRESAFTRRDSPAGPDLSGTRDLPVLIVAGRDAVTLAAEVAAVCADLDGGVIPAAGSSQDADWAPPFEGGTVGVLNRGTPSAVVSPDGTLWLSLMRACSSWPSGVWIDGAQRATPDRSGFAWQHWSHTFEYALSAGPGAPCAEDFNHPLLAVSEVAGAGPSGASGLCGPGVAVSPANVSLTALKPAGNPLATGQPETESRDIVLRLRETRGRATAATVSLPFPVQSAWLTDLLERSPGAELPVTGDSVRAEVPAFGTVTVGVRPVPEDLVKPAATPAGTEYGRYWLHGTGPAPADNLPVAVHATPARVALPSPGDLATTRLSVACGPAPAAGEIELSVPPGLTVMPSGPLAYALGPREHQSWDLTIGGAAEPGRYFVAARDRARDVEDTILVAVGEAQPPDRDMDPMELFFRLQADNVALTDEVRMTVVTPGLELAPGSRGEYRVRVDSQLASQLRGRLQVLSPFGSWEAVPEWEQPVVVAAGGSAELVFPVTVPATARPGSQWWLLAKLMYFGRVGYSEAVPLAVRA
jgi:alpha-mannosidase